MNLFLFCEITLYALLTVGGGAGISVTTELMYETTVPDLNGNQVHFEKPWYLGWLMVVSFLFVFIPYWFHLCHKARKKKKNYSAALDYTYMEDDDDQKRDWGWVKISILAFCNLAMKVISNVGLIWLPVSIWQMLRGSSLIFTAILTITYRHRKLFRFEWIGIIIVIISLLLLSTQALLQGQSDLGGALSAVSPWLIVLGIVFTVLSQGIESIKTILMEKFLNDSHMHSIAIVAWQGFWGFLVTTFVILPICYFIPGKEGNGIHENSLATLYELHKSATLIVYTVVFIVSMVICNVYAAYLIVVTNALTRIVLEQFRALLVWLIALFIHYAIRRKYGEPWTMWSFMELGGFILMTFGVIVYAGAIRHPVLLGPAFLAKQEADERTKSKALKSKGESINTLSGDYHGTVQLSDY